MPLSRRGFVASLVAALATPAIVRAGSLELVRGAPLVFTPEPSLRELVRYDVSRAEDIEPVDVLYGTMDAPFGRGGNILLTRHRITREAIKLFQNSNPFLAHLSAPPEVKIGSIIRVQLPNWEPIV